MPARTGKKPGASKGNQSTSRQGGEEAKQPDQRLVGKDKQDAHDRQNDPAPQEGGAERVLQVCVHRWCSLLDVVCFSR